MITHKRKHHLNWKRRLYWKLTQIGYSTFNFPSDKHIDFNCWTVHKSHSCIMTSGRFIDLDTSDKSSYKEKYQDIVTTYNVSKILLS